MKFHPLHDRACDPRGDRGRRCCWRRCHPALCQQGIEWLNPENDEQKTGIDIVRRALQAPARQIFANAGADGSIVIGKLLEKGDATHGFDAQSGNYVNMLKAGIIDPTKVVRLALQGAASIAGLLITTEAMIAEKPASEAAHAMSDGDLEGGAY